jgi:ribonuclease P protein component
MAAERLTRADFTRIRSGSPRRFHGRYFSLSITRQSEGEPKFACVVSKKAAKRAVDRNRIKRRAKEALGAMLKGTTVPVSLVLYAKKEALTASYSDLAADIRALLAQMK